MVVREGGELTSVAVLPFFRVPVSTSDMDTVLRVIDPDQSGYVSMDEWLDFMLSTDDDLAKETLSASQQESKNNAEAGGEGLMAYVKYGEEAIDFIPGGSYVTKSIKDPIGTVVNVGNGTIRAVTDPIKTFEDELLPVLGVPEERKPVEGDWDPAGNTATARGGKPLTHEVGLTEDDELAAWDTEGSGDEMDNPLAKQASLDDQET